MAALRRAGQTTLGSGPLLLLPGLCCTGRLWQAQVAALQAAGTDRGASHGIFVGDPHRGDSLAATAAELLEQLPPGPVAVVG
eukprot:SAG22_NODE_20008_length_269_cov_0.911765_1_plen_81_part_10